MQPAHKIITLNRSEHSPLDADDVAALRNLTRSSREPHSKRGFLSHQGQIGKTLGISIVTVNRTRQILRRIGAMEVRNGDLTVLDWKKLVDLGDLDPDYLHLKRPSRMQAQPPGTGAALFHHDLVLPIFRLY